MLLLDVNILVQAHREDADLHEQICAWLEEKMCARTSVAVSELALSGCLRITTHPKIFMPPTPLDKAVDFVEDFRARDDVQVLSPDQDHWRIFIDLCRRTDARGNLVPDAYHAALAIEHGCEWITLDRGFSRYPDLKWRHPFDP